MTDLAELVAEGLASPDPFGRELAARVATALESPRKTVAAAFELGGRGGESELRRRARIERDAAIRELAATLPGELSVAARAKRLVAMLSRYSAAGYLRDRRSAPVLSAAVDRFAMFRALASGLGVPKQRQIERILLANND
jgi:hypothetical protein